MWIAWKFFFLSRFIFRRHKKRIIWQLNWHDNWEDLATLYMPEKKQWDTVAFFYTHIVENLCVSLGSLQFAHVPTRPCSSIMYICDDIACIVRIVSGKIIISREHFYCFHFVSFGHHRSFQHFNSRITLKTFNLPNKKRKRKKNAQSHIKKLYVLCNYEQSDSWIRLNTW